MIPADFLIEDADLVATCAGAAPRTGAAQGDIGALPRASVASFDGQIVFVGRAQDARHELSLKPDATVVSVMGDGSFGFTAGEMETIVRLKVPVTMVVISNSVYGWIKAGQKTGSQG